MRKETHYTIVVRGRIVRVTKITRIPLVRA